MYKKVCYSGAELTREASVPGVDDRKRGPAWFYTKSSPPKPPEDDEERSLKATRKRIAEEMAEKEAKGK